MAPSMMVSATRMSTTPEPLTDEPAGLDGERKSAFLSALNSSAPRELALIPTIVSGILAISLSVCSAEKSRLPLSTAIIILR